MIIDKEGEVTHEPLGLSEMLDPRRVQVPAEPAVPPVEPPVGQSVPPVIPPVVPNTPVPPVEPPVEPTLTPEVILANEIKHSYSILGSDVSVLSEEDKDIRNTILNTFKGTGVDTNGNLINAEGKVVLKTDGLKKFIETGDPLLDNKGNQTNELGEIIRSKDQIDRDNSIVLELRGTLQEQLALELPREDYSDTNEGLVELVQDAIAQGNKGIVGRFLDDRPELKSLFFHLENGGTIDTYSPKFIDYKGIDVVKADTDTKLGLIRTMFSKQGITSTDTILGSLKLAGEKEINKAAAEAVLFLDQKQEQSRKDEERVYKENELKKQEEVNKYWNEVDKVIEKGVLGNISIPIAQRKAFSDYLSKPVNKNGDSADFLAQEEESLETQLMVSYLRFNKFDMSKLVKVMAGEEKVKSLRERMAKGKEQVVSDITHNTHSGTSDEISLETLHGRRK